ncbi:MAG: IS1182 family transposase, partial [Methylococcaceae bacterium]
MSSRRYQQTLNRQQEMLLPCRVEEYVSKHNTVRAIDAYVDTLDLQDTGFKHSQPVISSGQPPYNPMAFLKLYLYGYMQGIRSSRKLERETYRNLEVMWLIEGLTPTYKSIANFRKDNSRALKTANRDFLLLCKELSLFGSDEVAVDGSFFKGDVSKNNIYTKAQLNKQLDYLDKKITAYQEALEQQDTADNQKGKDSLVEDEQLEEKLKLLQEKQAQKKRLHQRLKESGEKQIATVDKDARLLSKRGQTIAGYNAQTVVDSKHKLIVAEEVTQEGNDTQQLAPMLEKAQGILDTENLTGLGDSGYYSSKQIKACEDKNISVYVPIPKYSDSAVKQGRFARDQFQYDAENNVYHCPQGNMLTPSKNVLFKKNREVTLYQGKSTVCHKCPLRSQCITEKAKTKKLERWLHEEVIDRHKERMQQNPCMMRKRGALVEHPFGTLKHRAGMNHFLMRG